MNWRGSTYSVDRCPDGSMLAIAGPSLQQIINDSCAEVNSNSSDFWVMVAALKVTHSSFYLVKEKDFLLELLALTFLHFMA